MSVNGLTVTGGASPVALLADLRRRARDPHDPFNQAAAARHTELVFNVAVDDLISLFIDPRNPGIDWTFLPRPTKEGSSCKASVVIYLSRKWSTAQGVQGEAGG